MNKKLEKKEVEKVYIDIHLSMLSKKNQKQQQQQQTYLFASMVLVIG